MRKAMLITVGTGRNREDIAEGIVFSIKRENPEFLCFFVTPKSNKETLPLIVSKLGINKGTYRVIEHGEADDIQELYMHYDGVLRDIINEGFSPEEIVIDYTSGTKSMSAALFAVGIAREVGAVTYISGKRDDSGRVIQGTEKQVSPNITMLRMAIKLDRFSKLFNSYQFEACMSLLSEFEKKISQETVKEKLAFLESLTRAYMLWDRFDTERSLKELTELSRRNEGFLRELEIKGQLDRNKELLYREKQSKYSVERIVDLFKNAERRFEEGKYDDAVARLYRTIEYMAQVRLFTNHNGIETGDLDMDRLREKLDKATIEELEKKRSEGKVKVGLVDSFFLLYKLGDKMGRRFVNEFNDSNSELKKYINLRNQSILAHGFTPIGREGAEKLKGIVESYLNDFFPSWKQIEQKASFPKIRDVRWI